MKGEDSSLLSKWLSAYSENLQTTKNHGRMAFCTGNHDRWRMRHYFEMENMVLNMALIMTMPGVPFIYYGDEIGMRYQPGVSTEGSGSRGGSRTPMQWDKSVNFGFSAAEAEKLYLPVDKSVDAPVVSEASEGKNPVYTEFRKLIDIRRKISALHPDAEFEVVQDKFPLIYRRINKSESCLVLINPCKEKKEISLKDFAGEILWNYHDVTFSNDKIVMPPVSAAIVLKKQ